jgi:PhnB protein
MFDGNCEEAMNFYAAALGAKVKSVTRGKDTPMADHMPPGKENSVVNAQIELPGGGLLYGGDAIMEAHGGFKGFTIALNYPTVEEGEKAFNAISQGGTVSMAWSPTFWAKAFGMCDDKFGVSWIINGELNE